MQFESALLSELSELLGFERLLTIHCPIECWNVDVGHWRPQVLPFVGLVSVQPPAKNLLPSLLIWYTKKNYNSYTSWPWVRAAGLFRLHFVTRS